MSLFIHTRGVSYHIKLVRKRGHRKGHHQLGSTWDYGWELAQTPQIGNNGSAALVAKQHCSYKWPSKRIS